MKKFIVSLLFCYALMEAACSGAENVLAVDVVPALSRGDEPKIFVSGEQQNRFYVVISNLSDHPQRVYEDWNSWGYDSLKFEAVTKEGKKVRLKKKPGEWSKNFASTYTIPVRGHYVLPVRFSTNEWENVKEISPLEAQPIQLKAVFEIPKPDTNAFQVWVGRTESASRTVKVENWDR